MGSEACLLKNDHAKRFGESLLGQTRGSQSTLICLSPGSSEMHRASLGVADAVVDVGGNFLCPRSNCWTA